MCPTATTSGPYVAEPGAPGHDIKIDAEFCALVPTISDDERKQLEHNIAEHGGARDPLTVWLRGDYDEVLLDGHNRYEICTRLGLPFSYVHVLFDTRDEAADWIDRNQLGRRNLSKQDYKMLLGRRYNRAKKGQHDGGKGKERSGGQNARHSEKTSERLAREHGVDEKTVRRAGDFAHAVEKLGITGDIIRGTVYASESEVVAAASALPDNATDEQRQSVRQQLKRRAKKPSKKATRKRKPAGKPSPKQTPADEIADEIRTAAVKAWQRLKDKFPPNEHGELRKVLAGIIREEQKQFSK